MTTEEIIETATIAYKKCNHIPNLRIPKEFIEIFAKLIAEKEHMIEDNLTKYASTQIDKALSYSEAMRQGYIQAKEFEGELWIKATHYHIQKQEQGEPVAYINVEQRKLEWAKYTFWETPTVVNLPKIPLYTKPQQGCDECGVGGGYALYCVGCAEKFFGKGKEWVGLTTEQMMAIAEWQISAHRPLIDVIKAVEQALKEKNT